MAADLLVTEPLPEEPKPNLVTFSGGVAEYLYFRELGSYDDFGRALALVRRRPLAAEPAGTGVTPAPLGR